ncbi:hypothetical protein ABFS83_04G223500 [Erythranthe nasuta]
MSCKIALSKSSFNLLTKSNQSTKTHFPESISFTSQFTESRISIRNSPIGPQRRARPGVKAALHGPPAECEEEEEYSLYELLGIGESGRTLSDIKKAYKEMARKYHPDVSPPDRVDEYTRRFIMVKQAYDILSNPQRRASYDRDLSQGLKSFVFSATKSYKYDKKMEEKREWKIRWQSQLDELKTKSKNSSKDRMSWGARMRAQT